MDDLSGLQWSAGPGNNNKPAPMNATSPPAFYPTLSPSPSLQSYSQATTLPVQNSAGATSNILASKPAADSFSNLVNFSTTKNNANLSLRERQEQLAVERRRKEEEEKQRLQSQYGGGQFWDTIGQGSWPASRTASPAIAPPGDTRADINRPKKDDDDEDLFAAFNKNTKVDNASHYPPPSQPLSGTRAPANVPKLDLSNASAWDAPAIFQGSNFENDDDDPFGLNQINSKAPERPQQTVDLVNDDDILGDLGKPVEEVLRKVQAAQPQRQQERQSARQPARQPGKPIEDSDSESEPERPPRHPKSDSFDKAVAELVDMGFTADNARRGLTESGAGLNVQAAVSWLLDEAHRQARDKQKPRASPGQQYREGSRPRETRGPAWMKDDEADGASSRRTTGSPAPIDDISRKAAVMGSNFLKTANSLWKSGQKQLEKAVADFQQEMGDPDQPKWMRSAQQDRLPPRREASQDTTDEVLMLESGRRPERQTSQNSSSQQNAAIDQHPASRNHPSNRSSTPKWQQPVPSGSIDPRDRLKKQMMAEESAPAYVSPARRKKATPQPPPKAEPEADLLFGPSAPFSSQATPQRSVQPSPVSRPIPQSSSRPISPRPPAPTRVIPTLPSSVLQSSARYRQQGTEHFKRGDYDAAHVAYTNALSNIPESHPIRIVILTNRALTSLKTGTPKQAVSDADAAIEVIGPSRGEAESVALPGGETRDMKELYGKALSRKAEALEQMEKWADAGSVWQQCVEAGVGGPTAIAGRQRCQKALAPKPKPTPQPAQTSRPRPKPAATSDLAPQKSSEAVQRLREANKAAEAADDEKFALSEKVDAKIAAWRDGKRDNLRALIGSLDQVLWENSNWKKVGLHELVMANKVKIHYMKAIAKCHPDKLPQDANTETRLIAATVFATLNESWDKFKADNGL
ncbi:hypothetical protein GGR50DRAFT_645439 [Xylaria sp. CBS 124048]|nr:hypothetical protein GGR50DRAFT_645439 [Xylaria sp. CBS 124048]